MKNAMNWFEISAKDINRAKRFYETILGTGMHSTEAMGKKSAFFPAELEQGCIGGCIIEGKSI